MVLNKRFELAEYKCEINTDKHQLNFTNGRNQFEDIFIIKFSFSSGVNNKSIRFYDRMSMKR